MRKAPLNSGDGFQNEKHIKLDGMNGGRKKLKLIV